jgi:hypothetical protein
LKKIVISALLLWCGAVAAQGHRAVALNEGERITIDGRLDEAVWQRAPAHSAFQQQDPFTGKPAPFETRVRYSFDGNALYVAVHALDP